MRKSIPATVPAVGSYSRGAAGIFRSRAFLDKPLPSARDFTQRILAAAEPTLAALYWPCLSAKSALEDAKAAKEAF